MQTAQQLKEAQERLAEIRADLETLAGKIKARTYNPEKDGSIDDKRSALEAADAEVRNLQAALEIEKQSVQWRSTATTDAPVTVNVISKRGDSVEDARKNYRFIDAINVVAGRTQLSGLTKEMHEEADREMRAAGVQGYGGGVLIPAMIQEKRDLTAGTTTEGGFTIQTDVGRLIPFLDPQSVVLRLGATFLSGLQGNIDFPRLNGTSSAVWETEQSAADETTPTFDRVQLTPKRLAAFTEASWQLIRQSTISAENLIRERLLQARDNALDTAAISPQSGQAPTGIPGTSGVNTVTVAASPTWAKIVEFETAIAADNALAGNLAYLTTPQVAGILKQKKRDEAGNGFIWEGNNSGAGNINGYRALTSTLVPTTGGAHYMFFGNWSKLLVGQWGGMEITTDPYTRLKDATIQVVLNTWHGMAVEHGEAFAYSTSVHPS